MRRRPSRGARSSPEVGEPRSRLVGPRAAPSGGLWHRCGKYPSRGSLQLMPFMTLLDAWNDGAAPGLLISAFDTEKLGKNFRNAYNFLSISFGLHIASSLGELRRTLLRSSDQRWVFSCTGASSQAANPGGYASAAPEKRADYSRGSREAGGSCRG